MTIRSLALASLILGLAACSGLGGSVMDSAVRVIPRPDGVAVVYSRSWWRDRWRMPMDHGAASVEVAEVHQAFLYPADGGAPRPIPIDLAIDHENIAEGLRPDIPHLTWRNGAIVPGICREATDMTLDCSAVPGGTIWQRHRIEDVSVSGNRLVLARGPDGSANCAVDMSAIGRVDGNEWLLAHFPGRGTYLVDDGNPAMPLYRLQCRQAPLRLTDLAVPGAEWTEVIDIVPGRNPANPLVLYSSRSRFQTAILRDMTREIAALNTGAVERSSIFFLDYTGERIVLEDDAILRQTPGLNLTIYNMTTRRRTRLSWNHAYAPWPERP
jgi:hypothetical protein